MLQASKDSEPDVLNAEALSRNRQLVQHGLDEKGRLIEANLHLVVRSPSVTATNQAAAMRIRMGPEDPGGGTSVREPRRPAPSSGSGALELAIE